MPAGRPREFDPTRAVDGAMELLWRNGYRGTTTRRLEATLGVHQGSLYRAFGSKAALMDAAVRRYEALLARELLAPLLHGPGGLAAVDRFLRDLGEWLEADGGRGCLLGRLLAEGPPYQPGLEEALARFRAGLRTALTGALGRAAAAGQIGPDTVSSRAAVLEAAVLGLNLALAGGYEGGARRDMVAGLRAEVRRWHEAERLP